jgi:hypothetical protein
MNDCGRAGSRSTSGLGHWSRAGGYRERGGSFGIGANVVSGGVKGGTWLLAGIVPGGRVGGAAAGPSWRALRWT